MTDDSDTTDGGELKCPECGHTPLDTEDNNPALANDEQFDYFCAVCGELFEESDLQGGNGDILVGDGGGLVRAHCPACDSTDTERQYIDSLDAALVEVRACNDCGTAFGNRCPAAAKVQFDSPGDHIDVRARRERDGGLLRTLWDILTADSTDTTDGESA
jgi:DNA-directed RNA polymerase subunit RPC12/RpoP